MNTKILSTLGPSSLNEETVSDLSNNSVSLFRINLSHTAVEDVEEVIKKIQSWSDIPVCLDSEGAQIRNKNMVTEAVIFNEGDVVTIHAEAVVGDSNNISFTPNTVVRELKVGDVIRVDFNAVKLKVVEQQNENFLAKVVQGGAVGSNKASDLNRYIKLPAVTDKDAAAFEIGLKNGVKDFSLSFTNSASDVEEVREIIGQNNLISKIESIMGVKNLGEILPVVDQILIDRGDLSREVAIEKIPFVQRRIIAQARSQETPVFVATNLLESMIHSSSPTRAEVNDVASTLLMGASGLVLAAETAIGAHPVGAVKMINSIIKQYNRWSPESSSMDIIND